MSDEKEPTVDGEVASIDELSIEKFEKQPENKDKSKRKKVRKKKPVVTETKRKDPVEEFINEYGDLSLSASIALFASKHNTTRLLECDVPVISPSRNRKQILTYLYETRPNRNRDK